MNRERLDPTDTSGTGLPGNLVIRASAGSGKTFQLTNRFICLLHYGASRDQMPVDEILATTFTRKAAGEILGRVMTRLAEAATDESTCRDLAHHLGDRSLARDRCLALLEQLTGHLHRLRISTLDSFFSQVASCHGLELRLPPGWRIVDELKDARLRNLAIETILQDDRPGEVSRLMNLLTKGQAERSVSQLIRDQVDQLYGLFQETGHEAWKKIPRSKGLSESELADAVRGLADAPLPEDKRFHKAHQKDLEKAKVEDWESLIGGGLAKKVLEGDLLYCKKEIPSRTQAAYQVLLDHARAVLLGQLASQTEATWDLLDRFDQEYQRLKRDARAMRFDDVTRLLCDLVAAGQFERGGDEKDTGGRIDSLAFRMDGRIRHLLLDEFQDTSLQQWGVIKPIAESVAAGREESFFCVGDVKQAIYGWRGGVAEIFDTVVEELPDLKEETLERSYRSSPVVIDVVNQIFGTLVQHPKLEDYQKPVRQWCDRFPRHETARTRLPGHVTLEAAPRAEEEDQRATTLRYAAKRVATWARRNPEQSIGVLVRRNKSVGWLIYQLRTLGIAASEEGGNPLTDSAAVQLILSLLRLADHPGDTVAWYHLIHSPLARKKVSGTFCRNGLEGASHKRFLTPFSGIDTSFGVATEAPQSERTRLAARLREELVTDGYGPAIARWAALLVPSASRREASRLQQLVQLATRYEPDATLRPTDFVEFVEATRQADHERVPVRVMTIHQAKGLEFDRVVLPELDVPLVGQNDPCVVRRKTPTGPITAVCLYRNKAICGLLPKQMQQMFAQATARRIAESLSILYVALTRAAQGLHMIIGPSDANEKNLRKTYAGLLRAALAGSKPATPERVLFERGDPAWCEPAPAEEPPDKEPSTQQAIEPVKILLADLAGGRKRGLEQASPSGLEGDAQVHLASLFDSSRVRAKGRGTLVHAWLEQIGWLEDGLPSADRLRQLAARLETTGLDVEVLIKRLPAMLDAPPIAAALRRDAYGPGRKFSLDAAVVEELMSGPLELEVLPERPIAAIVDGQMMTGSIDRLVLIRRGGRPVAAEVLDYKTDLPERSGSNGSERAVPDDRWLAEKVATYRLQIDAYRNAVSQMVCLDRKRIMARLLFLSAGVVADL